MLMKYLRPLLIFLFIGLIIYFYRNNYQDYFSLAYAKNSLTGFRIYDASDPVQGKFLFFLIYVGVATLSLPGAAILTLFAGALFGVYYGTVIVSLASTIGACLAFLSSRYILRDWVSQKFSEKYLAINEGFSKDGISYLFSLRLIPIFPFFLVNILMGLTQIKLFSYWWVSQLGMLPATLIYVKAGEELSKIESLADIASPELLAVLSLLGLLPWFFKIFLGQIARRKIYRNFKKPKRFEFNTVVIGAGAAGLVSSYISAAVKAKVAIIESHKMGGDCLNYGCVPSKALIKSARVLNAVQNAGHFGIVTTARVNFQEVMSRIKKVIQQVEPHDSVERYSALGVECFNGRAKIISPFEVEINNKVLTTANIIIASGAEPIVPAIPGVEKVKYLTSENLWGLNELPEKLLIIGGGAIGCELAQAFQRLGAKVTLLEKSPQLLGRLDTQAAAIILKTLQFEGVTVLTAAELVEIKNSNSAVVKNNTVVSEILFTHILFAIGRKARTENSGFENLGLELNPSGTLQHNEYLQTKYSNIFVCGDVAGPVQLTHMASHQAWYAAVNALFSPLKKFKTDYRVVPSVVFTEPEVAQVGLTSAEAIAKKIKFVETAYPIDDLDRAICEGETGGFVKILTEAESDRIIGATIVGSHAGELIAEIALAMRWKLGLNKILSTVHSYPTWSEAVKMTAGRWRQNNKPVTFLKIAERFHAFRRG